MKEAVVIDMDGTLCDTQHRVHLAQNKQWGDFHALICDDKPNTDVLFLLQRLVGYADICMIGLTGRPETYRRETMEWLVKYEARIDTLLMRPAADFGSDSDVKPRLLAQHFGSIEKAREDVVFILDDRDKMVEAWRNLGFRCWQVQPGGY